MRLLSTALLSTTALFSLSAVAAAQPYQPGNLVISRSVYQTPASTIVVGSTILPGSGNASNTPPTPYTTAVGDAAFANVFKNETPDPSFGITSPIILDQVTRSGALVSSQTLSGITTSFPSKSEIALNRSADGTKLTFMGYAAPVNALDVSNSNTPGHVDPTNPVQLTYQRTVATVDVSGQVTLQNVNAYSGNNGRAAIQGANGVTYLAGNAGNGTKNATAATLLDQGLNGGIQIVQPGTAETTSAGRFTIAGVPGVTPAQIAADKASKDTNFRGLTIFNNTLYTTKGSGGNGINTVYQVGDAGTLPGPSTANTISILPGFPTTLATTTTFFPFGLFFADPTTLYVADEGNGTITDANAGLEKWKLVGGTWVLQYTLGFGHGLSTGPYGVTGLDPTLNPTTTGLRNIAGVLNGDGTVTIYGVTSTASKLTDQGADANSILSITDSLAASTDPLSEQFSTFAAPVFETVYRGIALAPTAVPEPASMALLGAGLVAVWGTRRRR